MIRKKIKINKKDIPIHEHLDVGLKCSYEERLRWLEESREFINKIEESRKAGTLFVK